MADLNVALILRFIDQATGPARAAIRNVQAAGDQVQQFGERQVAAGRAQAELAAQQTSALRGRTLAAAATGAALYGLMRPAVQFEQAMARVGAVSNATAQEQALLTATARELGATTMFSARQAADGMGFLAQAGFEVNEVVEAMPGLLNLAAAAGSDLGRTSDIASNILSGFGLQTAEMGRVGDVLVNTFTSSNVTLEMLGTTMRYVAPVARSLRIGLEETAAMAGILGNNGLQGEVGGTALRSILMRLSAPTDEAASALERLNIQLSDEEGNLRHMPAILAEMDEALSHLADADRAQAMRAIFGQEASGAAGILMMSAASGELQRYAGTLDEAGSAARVAAQMNDTAQGSLRRLSSATEEAQIALGNGLLPVLSTLVEGVMPFVVAAGQWIEANQELVTVIGYLAAALIAANVAVLALQWGFWLLFGWVAKVRIGVGLLLVGLGMLKGILATAAAWGLVGLSASAGKLAVGLAAVRAAFLALTRLPRFALSRLLIPVAWGASLIGRIPWSALAGSLSWGSLVRALSWVGLRAIPVIGWALLAGELLWHTLIRPMGWDEFIPQIDWSYWFSFEWASVLPRWDWSAIIPSLGNYLFGGRAPPSATSSDPAERGAAQARAQSLGYGQQAAPLVGARAIGGPVRPGFGYEVNEEGLEMFVPDQPGRILRASETGRIMAAGAAQAQTGGQLTIGDIHIHAQPGQSAQEIATEVRRQLAELAREARFALNDGGLHA